MIEIGSALHTNRFFQLFVYEFSFFTAAEFLFLAPSPKCCVARAPEDNRNPTVFYQGFSMSFSMGFAFLKIILGELKMILRSFCGTQFCSFFHTNSTPIHRLFWFNYHQNQIFIEEKVVYYEVLP
jgi:hypothetical protein